MRDRSGTREERGPCSVVALAHVMNVDVIVHWTRSLRHSSETERRRPTRFEGVVASAHVRNVDVSLLDDVA
ncbi:hypothetical protein Taro_045263 [Colocasia esculenta]|uniref:Uncharacterized protein n=1 Tax=Colocasia esculenta TaxID=4460 RepID=A0A843X3Y3_COLES|nr:hypothetical protein [Colocasia esculenta]